MTPVELMLSKLSHAKRKGKGWTARCPAHDDKRPSLSISEGEGGRALVHCHAGCTPEAITAELGLKLADLMPVKAEPMPKRATKPTGKAGGLFTTAEDAVAALERRYGPRATLWTYYNAGGAPVGVVVRWNLANSGKDIRPVSKMPTGWIIGGMAEPRPLYRLPELLARPDECVYVCEGEKAADAAASLGLLATTSPHGAKSAGKADWRTLANRNVVIIPDYDKPGEQYAADVARLATNAGAKSVRIVRLVNLWKDLLPGGDMVEYLAARRAAGLDDAAIRTEIEALADAAEPTTADAQNKTAKQRPAQADLLTALANEANYFHTPGGDEAYATVPVGGHWETIRINAKNFRSWLAR